MIDVAVATSVPSPSLELQNERLTAALDRSDLSTEILQWRAESGPQPYPRPARLTLLWSISEQDARSDEFHSWVQRTATESQVVNSPQAIALERDKKYLNALDLAGVPTVPSLWCSSASTPLEFLVNRVNWKSFVLKSAAGGSLLKFEREQIEEAQAHRNEIDGEAILQPYLGQVTEEGVLSLHFIDGELSHATRNYPAEGEWRTHEEDRTRVKVDKSDGTALEVATAALEAVASSSAFARVDLVRDIDGPPSVLQLRTAGVNMGLDLIDEASDKLVRQLSRLLQTDTRVDGRNGN